jgi:signal transduction histidine kinase
MTNHGGNVTVVSNYGHGSTFTISLPRVSLKEAGLNNEGQWFPRQLFQKW